MKIGGKWSLGGFALAVVLAAGGAMAHPGHHAEPAFSKSGPVLSYFSTPNREHLEIKGDAATTLARVTVELKAPSDVLVQFTSGLATVTPDGCPCSARVSLAIDDHDPVVIKRVNLGTMVTRIGDTYQPDRQSADGSYALQLPAGRHEIALIAQRIEGSSALLYGFYPNLQALAFPSGK
jgi:hypothetical protein